MSWHILHAGKFVDAEGVVLDRAEHEFLARTDGCPEALVQLIARNEPVPRLPPVEWQLEAPVIAGFTQTYVKLDGVDWTLRVIDHQAFEGPRDRPGRAYRKRTYLLKPAAEWGRDDAGLPVDLIVDPPHFQAPSTIPTWQPPARGTVSSKAMRDDVGTLLSAGRLHIQTVDADMVQRISAVLAALPAPVAARLHIHVGDGGQAAIQAPADPAAPHAHVPGMGAREAPDADAISAAIGVIAGRGRNRATIADHCMEPWQHATPDWDLARPLPEVRMELAWLVQAEAWLRAVDAALAARKDPPPCPLPPGKRILAAALGVFIDRDAVHRLDVVAGPEWRDAWAQVDVPHWAAITNLLAGRPIDDEGLAVLAAVPLAGTVAEAAIDAWGARLLDCGNAPIIALLQSPHAWAKRCIAEHEDAIVARALDRLCRLEDPRRAWDAHPLREHAVGRAIDAVLQGQAIGEVRRKALASVPEVADTIACLGDAAANAALHAAIGRVGNPARPIDPALRSCLDWIAGRPVTPAPGMVDAWLCFEPSADVAQAIGLGVAPADLEAILAVAPERIVSQDDVASVQALLAQGDRVQRDAWTSHFSDGAWGLLRRDHSGPADVLDGLDGQGILGALCIYTGPVRPSWPHIAAPTIVAWLEARRPLTPLAPLAAAGAKEPVATALMAWLRKSTDNTHPVPRTVRDDAQRLLDQILPDLGWLRRAQVKKDAKRLEAA